MRHRLDTGWHFHYGDFCVDKGLVLPEEGWRPVLLPHDWSIEPVPGTDSPFSPDLSAGKAATGHAVGGTGWYRTELELEPKPDRRYEILFEGAYLEADVWINGIHLASHAYGYTPFSVDVSPHMSADGRQQVVVRVRNEGHNARWYTGSGLYRPVCLRETGASYLAWDGIQVRTEGVSPTKAKVTVATEVHAETDDELVLTVTSPEGTEVYKGSQHVGTSRRPDFRFEIDGPLLWHPWDVDPHSQDEQPLYHASLELWNSDTLADQIETTFGIRDIRIDPASGMSVNGRQVDLKGGCIHHDNGILGAVVYERAEERKIRLLKDAGYNAIRTSHNPPSTVLLDACDRLGLLVIDEVHDEWVSPKVETGYFRSFPEWAEIDARAMVRRDRNHPCVFAWSIGNEIIDSFDRPDIALKLREAALAEDPTRPITAGVCWPWWKCDSWKDWDSSSDPAFQHLDIGGYNYAADKYEPDHARHPERLMMGTESYALEAWQHWDCTKRLPYVLGDFVWTAMDYIGESGIGQRYQGEGEPINGDYPFHLAVCGDIDLIGHRKPQSFYREALWRPGVLYAAVEMPASCGRKLVETGWHHKWGWHGVTSHWTWPGCEGKTLKVHVYTSCDRFTVHLNGRKLEERTMKPEDRNLTVVDIPYEPGTLEIISEETAYRIRTASESTHISLVPDRKVAEASREGLIFVDVTVEDGEGLRVPTDVRQLRASIDGPGKIVAFGNACPTDTDNVLDEDHRTWEGRALIVVRPLDASRFTLKVDAAGLESATIELGGVRNPD